MRIIDLENKLRNVKVIDEDEIDTTTVQIGNTVQVLDMEYDEKVDYTIVGSTEVDLANNKISNESPIGKALLGRKKNEVVEVEAPAGVLSFKILKITKWLFHNHVIKERGLVPLFFLCYNLNVF